MSTSPLKPDATALVAPVPEADPMVGQWRARFDPSAPLGVPAHVTLLYPFVAPDEVDAVVLHALEVLFARAAPVAVRFERVARRNRLTYLPPEPAAPLLALTRALVARWPACPPYRGKYGPDVVPHLSIGYGDEATGQAAPTDAEHAAIVADLLPKLPLAAVLREVWLLQRRDDRWSVRATFPLVGA